jgi:hypothetical protein
VVIFLAIVSAQMGGTRSSLSLLCAATLPNSINLYTTNVLSNLQTNSKAVRASVNTQCPTMCTYPSRSSWYTRLIALPLSLSHHNQCRSFLLFPEYYLLLYTVVCRFRKREILRIENEEVNKKKNQCCCLKQIPIIPITCALLFRNDQIPHSALKRSEILTCICDSTRCTTWK